jgi:hypothetical protein
MTQHRHTYRDSDGVQKTMVWDPADPDFLAVHTAQDVEPILDSIARDQELMTQNGDNKLAARLPLIVVEDLVQRGIFYDEPLFKAWLNSDEAAPWRVWKGRL